MRSSKRFFSIFSPTVLILAVSAVVLSGESVFLHAPSLTNYARHNPSGVTILSNGRFLAPVGTHIPVAYQPYGLSMSRDGARLFVASDGIGQIIENWQSPSAKVMVLKPAPANTKKKHGTSGGADFSSDGATLYWSGGESGALLIYDVESRELKRDVNLNSQQGARHFEDSYIVDVKTSADGSFIYCADVANFRVIIVNAVTFEILGSVPVGRYPYALAMLEDHVYVANVGLFEYSPVPAPATSDFDKRGLTRPAFGFPSRQARDGTEFEGRRIPGLGEANVPESFSVWGVDVTDPARPRVDSKVKTGLLIGAPAENGKTVGGSAPNFLCVAGRELFVSNGNNDTIEKINLRTHTVTAKARLSPSTLVDTIRGVWPAGMAVSPDGANLYVAEMSINAIAVIDTKTMKVLGHIPTAWYPYRVAISPDGRKLACICFRGFGNGPNAGKEIPRSDFLGMKGVLSIIDTPAPETLPNLTAQVLRNNGIENHEEDRAAMSSPIIPGSSGHPSKEIKYVVFITKENHSFDTIFDRVPGANDDPTLLRWGLHQTIRGTDQPTLEDVGVMVNHNALARQFTVSDNFYMEPEASGVGHRWLVGVQPNNLMQMTYSVGWSFKNQTSAPGRRYSMGSNGSLLPEDYPEAGSMWEHLARNRIRFRNYGEGFEFPGVLEADDERPTGAREVINAPMPKALFDNTCFEYPIFNMNIPDQYRAYWFKKDVEKRFIHGWRRFPSFINIAICNDHGTAPNPAKGYPYLASWMADNDLALGKIVDFLSHTPYWKNMAIFVTQDDSGGEPDHVDAQRSVLLVISPWARRGYVSHRHTTIVSMHRTLYEILGLPALNMFDALANDFSDCFTSTPDFRPYSVASVDSRIFDPEKAKDPKDPDYGQARRMHSIRMDDDDEMEENLRRGEKEANPQH